MSFLTTTPEMLAAAGELQSIGSSLSAQNVAVAAEAANAIADSD